MKRTDLAEILFSLPPDGSPREISRMKFLDAHIQQLVKQGYIVITEIEPLEIISASLTRLGTEWVQHHRDMSAISNIHI